MYHLISNFNSVLLLGWGILHPVCASRQHFLAIVTSSSKFIWNCRCSDVYNAAAYFIQICNINYMSFT